MTAFRATYSDWKLVKTRQVVQVVFEIPIEDADAAYEVLGGMPNFGTEQWFGIAAISAEAAQPRQVSNGKPAGDKPSREWKDLPPQQQAAMRCREAVFHAFLFEENGFDVKNADEAAVVVRQLCKVESRKEFETDPQAHARWEALDEQFQAWKAVENA